jgi:uncharacterized protein YndB with AHSA1/START domain
MPVSDQRVTGSVTFEMTRVFTANRARMWQAWSTADQLRTWWGPKGCTIEVARFEFRPGGFFHYAMQFAGAATLWGRFNYREIVPRERLVWLNSFANENCGIARAPFSEFCPLEIENCVTFTEHAGATTVSLRATPFGAVAEERKFFDDLRPSLEQGYGGTLDQLADSLVQG